MEVINDSGGAVPMGFCQDYCMIVCSIGCAGFCLASAVIGSVVFSASYGNVTFAVGQAHG